MIQRIQTIFLFLAVLCALSLFLSPVMVVHLGNFSEPVNAVSFLPATIFAGILLALSFTAIFMFKNRTLQMNLCKAGIVISIVLMLLFIFRMNQLLGEDHSGYEAGFGVFALILTPLFLFFSLLFIKKDEKLVRSLDRLR